MSFPEKINLASWRKRFPEFDYPAAALFLSSSQSKDKINVYTNLSWLARQYVPNMLMKYYALNDDDCLNEKKFATLERGNVYLSDPKTLNDPFDCGCAFYDFENRNNSDRHNKIVEKNMALLPSQISICSFSGCGVQSMPMWAHYSNNHKGFCVEYEKGAEQNELLRSFVYPVQYSDSRFDISDIMDEQIKLSNNRVLDPNGHLRAGYESQPLAVVMMMLYNIKHTSWSYEQEYRLSVPSRTPGLPEISAKPSKIYIGLNSIEIYSDKLKAIGKVLDIPVYKMRRSERSKSFNLIAEQVE